MNISFYENFISAIKSQKSFCLATVVETKGSTPRKTGAKMIVFQDGKSFGTIGGGLVEKQVVNKAKSIIENQIPEICSFSFDNNVDENEKMICGGKMSVFIEPFGDNKNLYIFGAGHCGFALAKVASNAGFVIHIFDDRDDQASKERFPMAATITVGDYKKTSAEFSPKNNSFVAIMTQGHSADADVFKNVLNKNCCYVGLMASKRKKQQIFEKLIQEGMKKSRLDKVCSPIGLNINAETPEEIAVSITAELIERSKP